MQTGTKDRKKVYILAGLIVIAAGVAVRNLLPSRVSLPGIRHATSAAAPVPDLDPRLHLDRIDQLRAIRYAGAGRDLFKMGAAPAAIRSAGMGTAMSPANHPAGPPPGFRPAGPPPPPPIDLKAFGYATQPGQPKKVFLIQGSDVYVATQGGVVKNRYQVLNIEPASVMVKDLQTQQTALLPLPPSLTTPGRN